MSSVEGVVLVLVALLAIPFVVALSRANELFVLELRGGQLEKVRGHVPPRLLADLEDVVRRSGAREGRLRVVREDGRPRLVLGSGWDEGVAQRLRNVVGTWKLAALTRR